MSRLILTVAAACMPVIGAPALAATGAEQVQIHGARGLSVSDFAELRGDYDLADGSRLSIEGTRSHPMAQLDDQAPAPLTMTGPNEFTDASGTMRVLFHAAANGSVSGLTLIYLPRGHVVAAARM